jgi:CRP/FNR family transcriptional regulator, transcriptional activator FtrB
MPCGTLLFEQGDMPSFQHVVLSGSVQLFGRSSIGREVLIEIVEPPDLVIPAAVVTASPYLMRARVPEPARLLLIHAAAFRCAVEREPLLAHAVIASLAGQFRRLVRQIKNLKLRSASERVGCYLLALSQRQGTPDLAVLPYEKNLIASELGMTRESFYRRSRPKVSLSRATGSRSGTRAVSPPHADPTR